MFIMRSLNFNNHCENYNNLMQLNLGVTLDEEMRKQVLTTQQTTTTSKKVTSFCGASFNGCVCQNICHCVSSQSMAHCFEALLKNCNDISIKEDSSKSEHSRREFGFDITETEEQLHRFLKAEHSTHDVLSENENLKKFLKYMEKNYKNQYETQRLIIEDLKLQVEDLMSQLNAAYNNLDQKSSENEDLLKNLERRKKDYDDVYTKLRQKENEIELMKSDRSADAEDVKNLRDKLDNKDRLIEDLEAKLKRADDKHRNVQYQLKKYINELHDRERELKNVVDGQNDALEEFQRKVDDLKKQLKDKDQDLQKKIDEINSGNAKKIKDDFEKKKRENDKLKDDLKKKDDDLKKLKASLEEAEEAIANNKKKSDKFKEAAKKAELDDNSKQRQIDDLKKKLADSDRKSKDKDEDLEKYKRDANDLADKLKAAQEELAKRQALIDFLNDELDKVRKHPHVNVMAAPPVNPVSSLEFDDLKRQNEKLKDKIRSLEGDLENRQREFDDKDREVKNLKKNMDDLDKKLRFITGEKDALKKLNDTALNASMLNTANLNSEVEKRGKQIKELTEKLENTNKENADLQGKLKQLKEELDKLKESNKKLSEQHIESQGLIDRLNKDKMGLIKNIKTLKEEKDKIKLSLDNALKTIKDLENELEKLRNELANTKSDYDRVLKEHDRLQGDYKDQGAELDRLKAAHLKLNQEYERMKLQFAQDRDKFTNRISELEITIKKIGEDTKIKDELQDAKNKQQELILELQKKADDLKIKLDMLENLKIESQSKDQRIEELEITIKTKLGEVLNMKQELDNLYHGSMELLREVWSIKVFTYDFNAMLTDRDTSDLKEQEKLVFGAKREQIIRMAMEISKDTKAMLRETYEETEELQNTVKNLSREKTFLLQKKQELEEKNIDLSKRHDAKTDMVGKLTVKAFILMSEIQRLTAASA